MLFSSIIFIFYFLPILLVVYFAIPKKYLFARNIVLLVFSLIFYSWGEPVYVILIIYSAFFNYFMAHLIYQSQRKGGNGTKDLAFALVINIFILCFFKYFAFLMDIFNGIFQTDIRYTALSLPIGISFYTFQALSYIIDVYRRKVLPQKSFLNFTLYITLFPQLIAGPIIKYIDIEKQLSDRNTTLEKIGEGSVRFIFGLGKKVILANNLGALHQIVLNLNPNDNSMITFWIGAIAYTLQIYFDFSGYSDMAIGLGKIFGFDFLENFNYPYISKTITEFWRRWHISLSGWFRDYLYIPLGGNRVSVPKHILNLLIVWSLTGLWHGASWNFVVWGIYYGILLILEKYIFGKYIQKISPVLQHIYALLIVIIGWVFFFSNDLTSAIDYLGVMFNPFASTFINMKTFYLLRTNLILLLVSGVCSTYIPMRKFRNLSDKYPILAVFATIFILIISVSFLVYNSYNPFLYFRF